MHWLDLEEVAERRYATAGLDADAPNVVRLVKATLGPNSIISGARPVASPAALFRVGESWKISVSKGLLPKASLFALAHEFAHWCLRIDNYDGSNEEACADYLAACLIAPRRSFLSARRTLGESFTALAKRFRTSETAMVLRLGETTFRPLAVVTPRRIRVRGPDEWCWPVENELRELARKGGPGITRAKLRDDKGRIALIVDETG